MTSWEIFVISVSQKPKGSFSSILRHEIILMTSSWQQRSNGSRGANGELHENDPTESKGQNYEDLTYQICITLFVFFVLFKDR